MVQAPDTILTLKEFLQLPETEPASEFIDGQIIQKPMPQGKHSQLQRKLVIALNAVLEPPCQALAFPELRCTFGGRSIVPDVAVFAWNRIPVDATGDIANTFALCPDWTIEILSINQNQTKVTGNILHCLQHGATLGWLIDPEQRSILAYPTGQQPLLLEPGDTLPVPDLASDLKLTVDEMLGWLKLPQPGHT